MSFIGDEPEIANERFPNFDLIKYFTDLDVPFKVHVTEGHEHEVAVDCRFCMERGEPSLDTKQRLWINVEKGMGYCYRCQWAGSFIRLVQGFSNTRFEGAVRILRGSPLDPSKHLNLSLYVETEKPEQEDSPIAEVDLPYGYNHIDAPHPYLEKRGIPLAYARTNDWGYSDAGYTKGRIIVPTFMDRRLVFWQARATWEEPGNKEFKKVLNPKGVSSKPILYNFDTAREFKQIVVTEGFMDAVKAGPSAVATNGKRLTAEQAEWLQKTSAKEIVMLWDADAWTDERRYKSGKVKPSSMRKAVDLLRAYGFVVKAVRLPPGRDPGSFKYGSAALQNAIGRAKEPFLNR